MASAPLKYRRILLKVSGESLAGEDRVAGLEEPGDALRGRQHGGVGLAGARLGSGALVAKKRRKAARPDARAPLRYRGEQEPIDPVAGRIPGAKNRFHNDNLSAEGTFKTPELLRSEFKAIFPERNSTEIIHYCGSGVTACHNALAMEIAGLAGSRVYIGSWSEWSADPTRPISRSA